MHEGGINTIPTSSAGMINVTCYVYVDDVERASLRTFLYLRTLQLAWLNNNSTFFNNYSTAAVCTVNMTNKMIVVS